MSSGRRVLVATRSAGKLRELEGILAEAGLQGVSLAEAGIAQSPDEDAIECHDSFEENALAKARHFNRVSGLPTIADDSGLCVDALGGAPGVRSKRYSGRTDLSGQALDDANNAKLLSELAGSEDKSAGYVCAAAFCDGHREVVERGETRGSIIAVARGDNGFGYDPYFQSAELGMTFGEASTSLKQEVSHRGRAFGALVDALGIRQTGR